MSDTTITTELGTIITSKIVRQVIYAIWVLALLVAGALHVWFLSANTPDPQWLTQSTAVLTYLGIPIGGLVLANTKNPKVTVTSTAPAPTIPTLTPAPVPEDPAPTPSPITDIAPVEDPDAPVS